MNSKNKAHYLVIPDFYSQQKKMEKKDESERERERERERGKEKNIFLLFCLSCELLRAGVSGYINYSKLLQNKYTHIY